MAGEPGSESPGSSSRIARDSFYSLVMRIVQLLSDAAILVITARGFGVEGRGLYSLVLVGTMFAQVPLFGVATPLSAELAHARRPAALLRGASVVVAAAGGAVIALVVAIAAVLFDERALLYVAVAAPPLLLLNYQQNLSLTRGHVIRYGLLFIAPSLVSLVALAGGLLASGDDADVAIGCWAAAQWLVPLAALLFERPEFRLRGEGGFFRGLLVRGAPVSLATGVSRLNYRVTTIVVAAMLPLGDVGRFSVAITGAETLWQLSRAVITAAYRSVVSAPADEAVRVALRVFRHSALLIAAGGAVGIVAAIFLVEPVFGEEYTGVWQSFAILVPGTIAFGASEVLRTYFTVRLERSREFLLTSLLSVLIAVAVSLALVPAIGIAGAAIGTSLGYVAACAFLVARFRTAGGEPRLAAYVPTRADLRRYTGLFGKLARRARPARGGGA
jgi:O-antigen/teichoic acid export membrane protein